MPKVGRVYRATACRTLPQFAAYSTEPRPHSLLLQKKKKAFCLFSNTSLSCGWGGQAWICSWQPPLQRASLAGPACRQRGHGAGCRIRSHYAICSSHLLLFSTGICSRGLCACIYVSGGALSSGGEEGGGHPSLPAFPETPNPN